MSRDAGARQPIRWRLVVAAMSLVCLTSLLWLARGPLPTPPLGSWAGAERWYERLGPAAATMAGLRAAATLLAGWLAVSAALECAALVSRGPRSRSLADLVAPRALQRLVHGLAGLSLTAGLVVPAPLAGALDVPQGGVAVQQPVDAPLEAGPGTALLRLVDPSPPSPVAAPPATPTPVAVAPVAASAPHSEVVVVAHGDSLWSIARGALVAAGESNPDDRMVTAYWRRLIERNRQTLVVPSNPDLIYAGQVVSLPTP